MTQTLDTTTLSRDFNSFTILFSVLAPCPRCQGAIIVLRSTGKGYCQQCHQNWPWVFHPIKRWD
jgi:hypothetical protein